MRLTKSLSQGLGMVEALVASTVVAGMSLVIADQIGQMKSGQVYAELLNDQIELQRMFRQAITDVNVCSAAFANAPFETTQLNNPIIQNFKLSGKPAEDVKVGRVQIESVRLTPELGFSAEEWSVMALVKTKKINDFNLKPFGVSLQVKIDPANKKIIKFLGYQGATNTTTNMGNVPNCQAGLIIQPSNNGGWVCVSTSQTNSSANSLTNSNTQTHSTNTNSVLNPHNPPLNPPPAVMNQPPEELTAELPNNRNVPCEPAQLAEISCPITEYSPATLPTWYT